MSEAHEYGGTVGALYALLKKSRTKEVAIEILGPPPPAYGTSKPTEASLAYAEFLYGLTNGMERAECAALFYRGTQGALGEEGKRLADQLIKIVSDVRVQEVMEADQARASTEAEFKAAVNNILFEIVRSHGQMRGDGTLKAYLEAKP